MFPPHTDCTGVEFQGLQQSIDVEFAGSRIANLNFRTHFVVVTDKAGQLGFGCQDLSPDSEFE